MKDKRSDEFIIAVKSIDILKKKMEEHIVTDFLKKL